MSADDIEHLFTHHRPSPAQVILYERFRAAAKQFAYTVLATTPPSADQTAAIRKIREAVMTANASIALAPPAAAR